LADVSNKADGPEIINQCFSVLDKDGTGVIKVDEFKHVLKSIGDVLSDDEV
jgi:Ca2+-binding EF-hand superfamily protein